MQVPILFVLYKFQEGNILYNYYVRTTKWKIRFICKKHADEISKKKFVFKELPGKKTGTLSWVKIDTIYSIYLYSQNEFRFY